jgi:hypothetical protein
MVVIEDKGTLKFTQGEKELSLKEGFARLEHIYKSEPAETRAVIDRLKRKYWKELTR